MKITEFLEKCLAEDEAAAFAAASADPVAGSLDYVADEYGKHIARWDPARVLREVEAKRKILTLHSAEPGQHPDFCGHDKRGLPCPTVRALAAVHSDQPNYNPEWR
jgi:hypothetical protein